MPTKLEQNQNKITFLKCQSIHWKSVETFNMFQVVFYHQIEVYIPTIRREYFTHTYTHTKKNIAIISAPVVSDEY